MIIEKKGNINIVSLENGTLGFLLKKIEQEYTKLEKENLVVSLFSIEDIPVHSFAELLELSERHKSIGKSFVIAYDKVNIDEVPEALIIVPSLQEAFDIVEMEEIERDLGF